MSGLPGRAQRQIVVGLGVFLVVVAVGALLYVFCALGAERAQLERLTPFRSAQASQLRVGQPILVTVTIGARNEPLIHDLVLACEETQDQDGRAWMPRRQLHRPLVVTHDGIEFVLTLRQACVGGNHRVIPNPESNLWRWTGFRRGDTLTVVGTVVRVSPPTLRGEHAFGGSVDDYRDYLGRARWYVVPFSALFLLVGFGLIINAIRQRRGSR